MPIENLPPPPIMKGAASTVPRSNSPQNDRGCIFIPYDYSRVCCSYADRERLGVRIIPS